MNSWIEHVKYERVSTATQCILEFWKEERFRLI